MSIFLITCCDDVHVTRSLLGPTRVTKLLLLIAGAAQYARDKISYYHCTALSNLILLLTVPDLSDFRYLTLNVNHKRWYSDNQSLLSILPSGLHIIFLVSLVLLGFPLWSQDEWCLGENAPNSFVQQADRISNWKGARLFMANYAIVFEALLILNTIRQPPAPSVRRNQIPMVEGYGGNTQSNCVYQFNLIEKLDILLRGWSLTGVLTVSLHFTVTWLYEISEQDERQWSFGQVAALASVILSVLFQSGDFLLSPTANIRDIPRYKYGILQAVSAVHQLYRKVIGKVKALWRRIVRGTFPFL
jgi:hypothetical protein